MTFQFANMTPSSTFFDVVLFLLLRLVTGQNFTTFTVSELLRENQQVGVELPPPPHQPPRLGLIAFDFYNNKLHYDNDPSRLF